MHGQFDKPVRSDERATRYASLKFLILPIAIIITFAVVAVIQPYPANWIAEAVQAEFVGGPVPSDPASTQLAQPAAHDSGTSESTGGVQTAHRGQR